VNVQAVRLNGETKKCRHRADRGIFLLSAAFIGQGRQNISTLRATSESRTLEPHENGSRSRAPVQAVRLNGEAKKCQNRGDREIFLLPAPFIGRFYYGGPKPEKGAVQRSVSS